MEEEEFAIIHEELEELIEAPIVCADTIPRKKRSLGLKVTAIPENIKALVAESLSDCSFCRDSLTLYRCLLCSQSLCSQCFSSHQERHQLKVYIELQSMRVHIVKKVFRRHEIADVFFNEFQMSFYECSERERAADSFSLRTGLLDKALRKLVS